MPQRNASNADIRNWLALTPVYVVVAANCQVQVKMNFGEDHWTMPGTDRQTDDNQRFGNSLDMDLVQRGDDLMAQDAETARLEAMFKQQQADTAESGAELGEEPPEGTKAKKSEDGDSSSDEDETSGSENEMENRKRGEHEEGDISKSH